MGTSTLPKQDLLLHGRFSTSANSARAGFLPIPLEHVPLRALDGIDVYLKTGVSPDNKDSFTLFCARVIQFTEDHRQRLAKSGVKFLYLPIDQQGKFRQQMESSLLELAANPAIAISVRAEIVYETSVELVNELLSEPDLGAQSSRLESVSRAVTMLVLNDPTAFSHLFAAAHHDFYTATHLVNVATCMVALAQALGHHNADELNHICEAGLLHDIGKMRIPAEILNKSEHLSDQEWRTIQKHPELGRDYLSKYDNIHPLASTVAMEHHERMDGSGYPRRLLGEQIHPVSRICAVVDSFDAMTAFRPFKQSTSSVAEAMKALIDKSPAKYDVAAVQAWAGLVQNAAGTSESGGAKTSHIHRDFERFQIHCPARLHLLEREPDGWHERLGVQLIAHNISRSGVGVLSRKPLQPGDPVRVYLSGEASLNQVNDGVAVRCRQHREGWFEIGIKYAPLSSQNLPSVPPLAGAA
jgi:HD-GYP domain-containing protein (c-di-GMP phosphodiesterase class II)